MLIEQPSQPTRYLFNICTINFLQNKTCCSCTSFASSLPSRTVNRLASLYHAFSYRCNLRTVTRLCLSVTFNDNICALPAHKSRSSISFAIMEREMVIRGVIRINQISTMECYYQFDAQQNSYLFISSKLKVKRIWLQKMNLQ